MYYLTDNPWPAIIILGGLAICAFVTGHPTLRKAGLVLAGLACLVYLVEDRLVSTRERIEVAADEILQGFKDEDLDAITSRISDDSPELKETAQQGMAMVRVQDGFHIRSVRLVSETDDQITVRIRANGRIMERSQSMTQHVPEFWETTWVNEENDWKLSKATRLDPVSGKPRGTFDRR